MPEPHEYRFSDDSKLGIVQARFEALGLGSRVVEPLHLVLGLTKALPPATFEALFPDGERFGSLCRALGAEVPAARVATDDITYSADAMAAVAGAHEAACAMSDGTITSMHLLLGVHRPARSSTPTALAPSMAAAALDAAGATAAILEALLSTMARETR